MPTFSIIIPTFNSETTLEQAWKSLASQTHTDFELCIMDGGSTDGTANMVRGWQQKDERIRLFQEPDQGIYDAMNKGMAHARGTWLLFLGSDDKLFSETTLHQLFQTLKMTKADVVYGNAKIMGDTGWAKEGAIYDGPFNLKKLLQQNICHQAICYQSQFVKESVGTYDIRYVKSADWDFNLRCWSKGTFQYVDQIIAIFAAGGASTHSTDHILAADFVGNLQRYFCWSLYHPMLNTPRTWFYHQVLKKQREKHPIRWKLVIFKRKFKNKISRWLK